MKDLDSFSKGRSCLAQLSHICCVFLFIFYINFDLEGEMPTCIRTHLLLNHYNI